MVRLGSRIGGEALGAATESRSPWDGSVVGEYGLVGWEEMDRAIDIASGAFARMRRTPRRERKALLRRIAEAVREARPELAELLVREIGKPVVWAEAEVDRLALTFDFAADLLSAPSGVVHPLDLDPRGDGHVGRVERFPIGAVLAIVPYNWPYNLAAHKLAPALAAGNPVVLKPARQAALSTLKLVDLALDAGCPPDALQAVACPPDVAERAACDPRVSMVSFTGSPAVGWRLKDLAARKRVSLELGGDAAAVVMADADLDWAVRRIVAGGYGYAGQVCIAVQRVLADRAVCDELRERLIAATSACPCGDPADRRTVCGPLIDEASAGKVEEWVREAMQGGARLLAGGGRRGTLHEPTLLEGVPPGCRLAQEEVFGPVLTLEPFEGVEAAIERVNRSKYGIHVGVFTRDLRAAERFFQEAEVGGVVVGDYPTLRFDNMPYGGVKRSGFGREGVAYAFEEMTEPKALVVRTL
ncbi:MAG: aldehyde dehydrogenase family protein [Fimbriimonadales bacterium]|nr:aldehyde dehydrogenase family protein [Fimbriimonadales bacterium]